MTKILLVAAALVLGIGCENLHQNVRTGIVLGEGPPGKTALLIGNHDFTDFETAKAYVRSLPNGAILSWDVNSLGVDRVPLPGAAMTVGDFNKFCLQNGVDFRYVDAAPKIFPARVLVLSPSGFRKLCAILGSPAMNARDAGQLFSACGVAYAVTLQQFFENAGVSFPPGASVAFNPANGWLILHQTPESQEAISRIVWKYQTPDFDDKVQCLEGRMQARRFVQ